MAAGPIRRGALVVLEGCDRAGKTTQAKMLVKVLESEGFPSRFMCFPDRTTQIGKLIDRYLSQNQNMEDHAIHLLFSANRWEAVPVMKELLYQGVTVIVDRYAYSGVAFSAAKKNFSLDWCKTCDIGLPKPDLVLYFNLPMQELTQRSSFGDERYDKLEFQQKVRKNFALMEDETFRVIDAHRSIEIIHRDVKFLVMQSINESRYKPILNLWEKYPPPEQQSNLQQ